MKKHISITLCIVCAGYISFVFGISPNTISYQRTKPDTFQSKSETMIISYENSDSFQRLQIHDLLVAGLNDSVIAYCDYFRDKGYIGKDLYKMASAAVNWAKGNKSKAYEIVLDDIGENLSDYNFTTQPLEMLCDHQIGFNLASDTALERIAFLKISDYYKKLNCSEPAVGLQLIKLKYQWTKLFDEYYYEFSLNEKNKSNGNLQTEQNHRLKQQLEKGQTAIIAELKKIIEKNHRKLYAPKEIGNVKYIQFQLIRGIVYNSNSIYWDSIMKNSFDAILLEKEGYLEYLLAKSKLTADSPAYIQYADSLCKMYGCNQTKSYNINDSTILKVIYEDFDRTADTFHLTSKHKHP